MTNYMKKNYTIIILLDNRFMNIKIKIYSNIYIYMEKLKNEILKCRDIKKSSLNTYLSSIKILKKKYDNTEFKNLKFLQNTDKILNIIDDEKSITTKKNRLTAILVVLGCSKQLNKKYIDIYDKKLKEYNIEYMNFLKKQEKTDKQKNNWVEYEDIVKLISSLKTWINNLKLFNKKNLSNKDFNILQEYVLLNTYLNYPIRNDYANMPIFKLDDYNKLNSDIQLKNNYLILDGSDMYFYLNNFKNVKKIGTKKIKINDELKEILNKWLNVNDTKYFILKSNRMNPINENGLTKYLNNIFMKYFNKKVGSSLIRHIIISHKLKNEKTIKQKEAFADNFLHSSFVNELYRKV